MNITEELNNAHDPQTGSEQGLRSGSTAGDSHGETAGADGTSAASDTSDAKAEKTPGERRKDLLKEE